MKKKNNILKEVVVLLISIAIIFSSVVVTAKTQSLTPNVNYNGRGHVPETLGLVGWDNGMDYDFLLEAQEPLSPSHISGYPADDFLFDEDVEVCGVHWIGGYWGGNYQNGDFDWNISFYYDRGDGEAPGEVYAGPFTYTQDECNLFLVEDTGDPNIGIFYLFSVGLPENITFDTSKYWISIWAIGDNYYPQSGWGYHYDPIILHQAVFKSEYFGYLDWNDTSIVLGDSADMCFQLIIKEEPEPEPDLECYGSLIWTDIHPGDTVSGNFTVENVGDNNSLLDWEVIRWPKWEHGSSWTFIPKSGEDLTPEDGPLTIEVKCVTPNVKNKELDGELIVQNLGNPDDFCIIEVSLTTPKNKPFIFNFPLLSWLFERFPNAFPILRYMFGL